MTTIKPGGPTVAVDKRTPRGADVIVSLQDSGTDRVKTSVGGGDEAGFE